MLGRLLIGIVKGLIVGGLLGFAVAKLGFAAPPAIIAYIGAAIAGILIGLVAGKPIWAKDAKIEAGMKAFVGALLGAGLMYAVRRWLSIQLPLSLGPLTEVSPGTVGTLGGLAVTSFAIVAALLGGFYEADNTPDGAEAKPNADKADAPTAKRIAPGEGEDAAEDDLEAESEHKRAKK